MTQPRPRIYLLVLSQLLLCWLEAYLISKISLIGRVGIATIHKEYRILRSGWKTFLLLFSIQMVIIATLHILRKKYPKKITTLAASVLLMLAFIGLLTTLEDFLHTYTHRLLKERFHLGFYIFWLSWIGSCLFFLIIPHPGSATPAQPSTFPPDPRAPSTPAFPVDPTSPSSSVFPTDPLSPKDLLSPATLATPAKPAQPSSVFPPDPGTPSTAAFPTDPGSPS